MRSLSRTRLVTAAATVAALAVAAAVVILVVRGDDANQPSSITPAATGTASAAPTSPGPTAGVSPTVVSVPVPDILPYISETPGAWKRETFAAGTAPDVRSGLYILNAETGLTDRWTIVTDTADRFLGPRPIRYSMSEDDSWLFASDGDLMRVLNVASGRSWGWADANIVIYDSLANRLVLENRVFDRRTSGPVVVMDGDMNVAGRCAVAAAYSRQALLSKDGMHLAIVSQPSAPDPNALLVVQAERTEGCDVAGGRLTTMPAPPAAADGLFYTGASLQRGPDPASVRAFYTYQSAPDVTPQKRSETYRLLTWEGKISDEFAVDPNAGLDFSPDGTLVASSASQVVETPGEGATIWLSTVVADAHTGKQLFLVRGAWLGSGGTLPGSRWLADSSGLVVMIAGDPADPGTNGEPKRFGYQVVSRDGSSARWLPFSSDDRYAAPIPSPVAPTVFAIGRNTILDLANGRSVGNAFPWDRTSDFFGPWGSTGNEIRFISPLGGHGIAFPMLVSSLRIEKPPFNDAFTFVVSRTGSCLNLHDKPSRTATTTGCIPDGTRVVRTVVPLENTSQPLGAIVEGPDRWIHIQAPDSNTGWASANYLDWAP